MPILETVKRFGILAGLGLALLALLLPARASADVLPVVVQVQAPDGTHVQVSGEGALSYPRNGRFVRAQSVTVEGDHLIFTGLSLLGGRVTADRLVIPVNGFGDASLSGLRVEGRKPQGLPNQVIPLKDGGYVVSLQESLDGQQRKLAGLFVHLGAKTGRLPAGTEILVGVPARSTSPPATPTRLRPRARSSAARSSRARRTAPSSRRTTSPPTTRSTSPSPSEPRSMRSRTA